MSPKWTRTKIAIEITLLLQAYSCLLLVQAVYRLLRIGSEILIEIGLVLIAHSCLWFYDLRYKNVKQLILVEVVQLAWTGGI